MKDKLINLVKEEAEKKEIKLNDIKFIDRYAYDFDTNVMYLNDDINNNLLNQEIDEYKNNKNLKMIETFLDSTSNILNIRDENGENIFEQILNKYLLYDLLNKSIFSIDDNEE